MTALAVCLVLCAICFKSGRFFLGLWLAATFLSWAFLFGAGHATDRSSNAPKSEDETREGVWTNAECAKVSSIRSARERAFAPAAWMEEPVRRSRQG